MYKMDLPLCKALKWSDWTPGQRTALRRKNEEEGVDLSSTFRLSYE